MKKRKELIEDSQIIDILEALVKLREINRNQCECTVHRRTGGILEVCESCDAYCSFYEIYDYVMEHMEGK